MPRRSLSGLPGCRAPEYFDPTGYFGRYEILRTRRRMRQPPRAGSIRHSPDRGQSDWAVTRSQGCILSTLIFLKANIVGLTPENCSLYNSSAVIEKAEPCDGVAGWRK